MNRLNALGWLVGGLDLGGLADSVFWFVKNHGEGCYQFPILSGIGCIDPGFAHEISIAVALVAMLLVSIPTRPRKVG